MNRGVLARSWRSAGSPGCHGLDLACPAMPPSRLRSTIDSVLRDEASRGAIFLVLPVLANCREDVREALASASGRGDGIRICLALDRRSASLVPADPVGLGNVGLILDGVDEAMPLSDYATPFVDGIRFDALFLQRAAFDIRTGSMLEAALGLTRDLGLATLGEPPEDGLRFRDDRHAIDWTLEPTGAVSRRPRPRLRVVPTAQASSARTASGNGTLFSSR